MINGLIVGHCDIGESILRVLYSISGCSEHISYISNEGFSTKEMADKIKDTISTNENDGVIIFVDVYGGSCWRAAMIAKTQKSHIITGVNIPMLLSFINKRELFPFNELAEILEKDGKRGINMIK